jgi:hypothetical protein
MDSRRKRKSGRRRYLKAKSFQDLNGVIRSIQQGNAAVDPSRVIPHDGASTVNDMTIGKYASTELGVINLKPSTFDVLAFNDIHRGAPTKTVNRERSTRDR